MIDGEKQVQVIGMIYGDVQSMSAGKRREAEQGEVGEAARSLV